jgi:hypothetical protein
MKGKFMETVKLIALVWGSSSVAFALGCLWKGRPL